MSDSARLHLIRVGAAAATAGVQLLLPAGLPAVPHLAVLVIAAYAVALPVQLLSAPGREGMAMLWSWAGKAVTRGSLRRSRA
jgi:hypothetical protein